MAAADQLRLRISCCLALTCSCDTPTQCKANTTMLCASFSNSVWMPRSLILLCSDLWPFHHSVSEPPLSLLVNINRNVMWFLLTVAFSLLQLALIVSLCMLPFISAEEPCSHRALFPTSEQTFILCGRPAVATDSCVQCVHGSRPQLADAVF